MRFKKLQLLLFSVISIIVLSVMVYAADITSAQEILQASANVTNYYPTVDNCITNQSAVDPIENGTAFVLISFNVTDKNGAVDLNNSMAKVYFEDDNTTFTRTYYNALNDSGTCTNNTDHNATTREYSCKVGLLYWYQHGNNYTVRCSAGDNNDTIPQNLTVAGIIDYAKLVATALDGNSVDFATINASHYNTNVSDQYSPINITNTGNTNLSQINLTGQDLADINNFAANISVGRFWYDDDATVADAVQLTTTTTQITGVTVLAEDNTAGGNTDSFWVWFNVPSTIESGTYQGTWTLDEKE